MLPKSAGIAKFSTYINVVIVTIVSSFIFTKLNKKIAIDPFMAQSKIVKLGSTDAIKYMLNIKGSAVK